MRAATSETSDADLERLEHAITAALEPLLAGWLERGPVVRADPSNTKPTSDDPTSPRDRQRGVAAGAVVVPIVLAAATAAGAKAVADLGLKAGAAFDVASIGKGVATLIGSSAAYEIAQARQALASFTAGTARALARAERLDILKRWAAGIAIQAATYTMNAGREHALEAASAIADASPIPFAIARTWTTRGDAKVRPAHAEVAGQKRALGEPFDVAGVKMRYPGDTMAPPELTANCRCRLRYSITKG